MSAKPPERVTVWVGPLGQLDTESHGDDAPYAYERRDIVEARERALRTELAEERAPLTEEELRQLVALATGAPYPARTLDACLLRGLADWADKEHWRVVMRRILDSVAASAERERTSAETIVGLRATVTEFEASIRANIAALDVSAARERALRDALQWCTVHAAYPADVRRIAQEVLSAAAGEKE
jgi:hypothetical protein